MKSTLLRFEQLKNAFEPIIWTCLGILILKIGTLLNAFSPIVSNSEFSGISTVWSCSHVSNANDEICLM